MGFPSCAKRWALLSCGLQPLFAHQLLLILLSLSFADLVSSSLCLRHTLPPSLARRCDKMALNWLLFLSLCLVSSCLDQNTSLISGTSLVACQDLLRQGKVAMDGVRMSLADIRGDFALEADHLYGDVTVREALSTALGLRQPFNSAERKTAETQNTRIDKMLESLGLEHVADNIIGTALRRGLSGGQRRRCSLAIELVQPPTLLFLDEPTSGLDATTAYSLIAFLRTTARENGNFSVILSLQQPNTRLLEFMDHILLLGHGESNPMEWVSRDCN